MHQLVKITK